jgi:hypothetical protein
MRARGLPPKAIARTLGLRPAEATAMIREVATADLAAPAGQRLLGCWVSPGWSVGLGIDRHPEWRDVPDPADGTEGVACVLVAREPRGGRASVCGYLVDLFCLGVKNAVGPLVMDAGKVAEFRAAFFGAYPTPPLEIPLELAQHLVLGAAEFARGLGFDPHPDFAAAADHLGERAGPSDITFGRDGKPFYVEGPYDNARRVISTLDRSVGRDSYHFTVAV